MKLIALLMFIVAVCAAIYLFIVHVKKIDWKAVKIAGIFGIIFIILIGIAIYKGSNQPDNWCSTYHQTTNYPPAELKTAMDYFEKGNFDFDTGNCKEAIADYTKSIELNPKYPESFNNRAYTYMRMQEFDKALIDLNKALELNPNYVNALMNRGDVYNYGKNDKAAAIKDYQKIIQLSGTTSTSVCGHLFMANHNTKSILTLFSMPFEVLKCRSGK